MPQNILLTSESPLGDIKVVDFGLSRLVSSGQEIREIMGTPEYVDLLMLDETYSRVLTKIKSEVMKDKAPFMAFTTDCWSGATESLMSLTGHLISEDWSRRQVVLNVKPMIGSHSASYIQETFLNMIVDWDIATEHVVHNMVKGMRLAELPDLICTAHTLQLIVNEGLSSQRAVLDVIAILKSCATHFGHSVLAKQRLRAIQEEVGVPVHNIIQAVPARWNSTLHMLQRMYDQRRALNVYAGEHGHISCLSDTQWDIVCNLIDTLVPIEEVTMEMSNSESSAACIIPSVSVLKLMLREEGPSSAGIKTLCKTMLDRYKARAFASEETLEKGKKRNG
ncbi:hypothetical protein cypCar_00040455 [Cyprinus carpio]|nr:hypothetical protein cypCar_00040455 [Cyprinus carpio]